jgi:hypothetical protein
MLKGGAHHPHGALTFDQDSTATVEVDLVVVELTHLLACSNASCMYVNSYQIHLVITDPAPVVAHVHGCSSRYVKQ